MKLFDKDKYRGPRTQTLRELIHADFKLVIDLESGIYEKFSDDIYEAEAKSITGFEYVRRIPCSDLFPPNKQRVGQFLYFIKRSDEKTYVHCLSGVDRTGFMVAVYRMQIQGWAFDAAYSEWVKEGRHWWYDWWKYSLKKWENK